MSYFLRVFCRVVRPVTRREIADLITAGSFFDIQPRFDPPPDSAEARHEDWAALVIHYDPQRRPIRIERNVRDALLEEEVREVLFVLERSRSTKARQEIEQTVRSAAQIFSLEVSRETVSEDCWEMLDAVQAFLAEKCDGIVYAPEDGFFDKNLRPLYKL
jgi:hypothetical protein